jgi:glucose-1-phosphate thymidylyltransferase
LFKADFKLNTEEEGIIWTQKVEDPSAFGVVKVNDQQLITDFIEKPQTPVSNLAIIGIYYFKKGEDLRNELQYLLDNEIRDAGGEYQITVALENMKDKGVKLRPGTVTEWLDCGNKDATVYTNQRYLEFIKEEQLVDTTAQIENSVIIPPVYLGKNVVIKNSVVGPHVSIGENSRVTDSRIINAIIQTNTNIEKAQIEDSMLGNFVEYSGSSKNLSVGDFNKIIE